MKRCVFMICLTALLIAVARDYVELAKFETQIEWDARVRIARALSEEMVKPGPKVEVPRDKPTPRPQPESWKL